MTILNVNYRQFEEYHFVFAYKKQLCCLGMQTKIVLSSISFGLAHQCSYCIHLSKDIKIVPLIFIST